MLKSIAYTYPDFRELPKGLKQLLLASENLFFSEARSPAAKGAGQKTPNRLLWPPLPTRFFTSRRETPPAQSRAFQWEHWGK